MSNGWIKVTVLRNYSLVRRIMAFLVKDKKQKTSTLILFVYFWSQKVQQNVFYHPAHPEEEKEASQLKYCCCHDEGRNNNL